MAGHLEKRSLSLAGHRTSVALEPAFWRALEDAAAREGVSLAALVRSIDAGRAAPSVPLASALRLHALAARRG
jgi:predicted DNA-binding ribbon-helix-helix protein